MKNKAIIPLMLIFLSLFLIGSVSADAWEIDNSTYAGNISIANLSAGFQMSYDGNYMYWCDNNNIAQYDLGTAWNITTATLTSVINTTTEFGYELFFKPDGTKMYESGRLVSGAKIVEYDLASAWDITSASYVQNISAQGSFPQGIYWKPDGTILFEIEYPSSIVYTYDCSVAWDLSSCIVRGTSYLTSPPTNSQTLSLFFQDNGKKMYVGDGTGRVFEWNLGTAWNVSTSVYNSKFLVTSTNWVSGIYWKPDGLMFFDSGQGATEIITQYIITPDTTNPLIDYSDGTASDGISLFSTDYIFVNVSVTEKNEDTIVFRLFDGADNPISTDLFTDGTRSITYSSVTDGTYKYYVYVNDTAGNYNQTATRTIYIYNNPQEDYPLFEGEIVYTGTERGIYDIMRSSGAGLGKLFSYLSIGLPVLLLGIAIAVIILIVGLGIAQVITGFFKGREK